MLSPGPAAMAARAGMAGPSAMVALVVTAGAAVSAGQVVTVVPEARVVFMPVMAVMAVTVVMG